MAHREHTKDTDCTIDSDTLCCVSCGVDHGDECVDCGGRGFHKPGCETVERSAVPSKPRCSFHSMLSALKVFAGFPVPWSVKWFGDKPDFRQPDERHIVECVTKKLCAVCGKRLGDRAFYVGGDLCRENGLFNDPAMHEVCARESMRLCPFLNGRRTHYRGTVAVPQLMNTAKGRPERMYLFKGWTMAQRFVPAGMGLAIAAGKLKIVEQF